MSRALPLNSSIGEYRLVDFIGVGGMGEVYRAVHTKIGRVAAIKILTQASLGGGFADRFFNEARIQASLQHPNIATLYDFLECGGQPCIVMEYVDGMTLADRIEGIGPLPLPDAIDSFSAVVEAISYIHEHGIVHRDIKSNNIKLSSTGQVKLLDFGIAKSQTTPGMTAAGSLVGTLEYLSPEQIRGGLADARSDIWALGVLLYEMVTGRVPFEAPTLGDLCDKIGGVAYTPPSQLNPAVPHLVEAIISRCLKKSPADRYQTAPALLQDVKRLRGLVSQPGLGGGVTIPPARRPARPSWAKKNWMTLGAGAAAVLLLFIVAGIYLMASGEEKSANENTVIALPKTGQGDAQKKTILIDTPDGHSGIWRDNKYVGQTPHTIEARTREHIRLVLTRDGYANQTEEFDAEPNRKSFSTVMKYPITK